MPRKKVKETKTKVKRGPRGNFGADVRIMALPLANWRREGTGNHVRIQELMAFMKKHPNASVHDILANTSYRKQDYEWDLERKVFRVAKITGVKMPKAAKATKPTAVPKSRKVKVLSGAQATA